jgi:asparagine synthase (glutamine-hydrolysing)
MCGICGSIGFKNNEQLVALMNKSMQHRGPDGEGVISDLNITLGMRRLKIIDLASGDQPIFNEDKNIAIVFNGEIFNFHELRNELIALGHNFSTNSDTEVIVHSYEEWGYDCVLHLRGMFSFAILDKRKQSDENNLLFIARDRIGIKPLYYWYSGNEFLFASEVRSLLSTGVIPKDISLAGVYSFLSFGSLQEPLSLVKNILSLPPGHAIIVNLSLGKFDVKKYKYWHPELHSNVSISNETLEGILFKVVEQHLTSDVPIGAFLSGGLDSGTLVGLASKILNSPIFTFTLAFKEAGFNESYLASKSSIKANSKHYVKTLSFRDIIEDLPHAIHDMDQPTIDGINSWFVSREAKKAGLTVALSGVGGDELFAGYPSFRQIPKMKKLIPIISKNKILKLISNLNVNSDKFRKFKALLDRQSYIHREFEYYDSIRGLFTPYQLSSFFNERSNQILSYDDDVDVWGNYVKLINGVTIDFDEINRVSWQELSFYMVSTLLRDTDMMSMAHSLEVRVPFVDHILLEYVLSIPGSFKLENGKQKPMLVNSIKNYLPKEIINVPKTTFTFPFQNWLENDLFDEVSSSINNKKSVLYNIFNKNSVENIWLDFRSGKTNWARPWSFYVLEKWLINNLS